MEKITDKKQVLSASLLFMFLYLISYVTRINYGAVISEICAAENMQKSLVSLALTMSAVTYGTGQLASGFLGDRLNPKKLIFGGLLLTAATNIAIPFCTSPYQMAAVWAVNGFAQAFMWPPLVKIMATLFTSEDYKKACVIVTWGSSFGTIAVYALSPVCISLFGWRGVFAVSAFFAVLMSVIWMKKCRFENDNTMIVTSKITETNEKFGAKYLVLMGPIMLAIVLQGILRDGVTTWMPSYISETFNLDRRAAILTGVILPIFSIGAIQLTSVIYRKFIKSELLLASAVFFAGFISALLLFSVNGKSAPFSILFFGNSDGLYVRRKHCYDVYGSALFCKIRQYIFYVGTFKFLHIYRQCGVGRRTCAFFGKIRLECNNRFVGGNRTLGRFNLPCGDKTVEQI